MGTRMLRTGILSPYACPMRCPVLAPAAAHSLAMPGTGLARLLRIRYAMPGTDTGYAATRRNGSGRALPARIRAVLLSAGIALRAYYYGYAAPVTE
eukprot:3941574-Rhodomonas_salina.4